MSRGGGGKGGLLYLLVFIFSPTGISKGVNSGKLTRLDEVFSGVKSVNVYG